MSSSALTSDLRSSSSSSQNDAEVLVRVENVSKIFCRDFKKSLLYGLQDSTKDLLSWGKQSTGHGRQESGISKRRKHPVDTSFSSPDSSSPTSDVRPLTSGHRALRQSEFYAVNNVSFELRRGECLGLIGRNGAGKTTLLKMLNGLIKPDAGRIEMRGRVGALIALGAGFNPILSGRENIYVNGSILGLSKAEIDAKIDDIIDFAEIGDFIDAPVQTYSSGMQVRLGFAVATAMEPDVLILDEVLAVGDTAFKVKCFKRISDLKRQCATIFVSHEALQVAKICSKATWLEHGMQLQTSYDVQGLLSEYEQKISAAEIERPQGSSLQAKETSKITIDSTEVTPYTPFRFDTRASHSICIHLPPLEVRHGVEKCELRLSILDAAQNPVTAIRCKHSEANHLISTEQLREKSVTVINASPLPITDGVYYLRISVMPESEWQNSVFFQETAAKLTTYGRGREWCNTIIFADCNTTKE
jgi:lipopolysaccharide transport system ATP-binding protein